jgi:hypothetical protein
VITAFNVSEAEGDPGEWQQQHTHTHTTSRQAARGSRTCCRSRRQRTGRACHAPDEGRDNAPARGGRQALVLGNAQAAAQRGGTRSFQAIPSSTPCR